MTDREPRPPRRQVNLQALPSWLQYIIALATVAAVVALAWHVRGEEPPPAWASAILVPALAWIFIAALVATLLVRLVRGPRSKS